MVPVLQEACSHTAERGEISCFTETLAVTAKELQTAAEMGTHLSSIPVISSLVVQAGCGACLSHCCRGSCCPHHLCFHFGLHSGNLGFGTDTRHRGSINLMTSEWRPEGDLRKAKMTRTFRARFYCAVSDGTLHLIDSGNTISGTKKTCTEISIFFRTFSGKKYFPNILVFSHTDFWFS